MNSKKIVSAVGAAVAAVSMMLSSIPAYAAVTTMPDGGSFDAVYYAATYPDVVAALGTDAAALYQHYKTFGAKEGRLPYAAGTTVAAPAASTTALLTATQRKNAQRILREYMTEKRCWGVMDARFYKGGGYGAYAENPRFIIADLNKDGVQELYTNGGEGWDTYSLQTGNQVATISGYNASLNMYLDDYGLEGNYMTFDGTRMNDYMTVEYYEWINWNDANKITVRYSDGRTQSITQAESSGIASTFVDIETLVPATALTAANVNAIK